MESKRDKVYKIIMLVLITVIITFMATSIGMYNYFIKTDNGSIESLVKYIEISDEAENITEKIEVVKKYLEEHYIGDLDTDDMEEMAIKGYVAGLEDVYTEYLTKSEYEELLVNVKGDFVGIGIYMYQEGTNGDIVVLMPIEGSPAEEAGLQPNDIIKKINGEDTATMNADEASTKIKGEEGTTVELEILRGTETINKVITRRKVEIPDSRTEVLENNIGYIELVTFDEDCASKISNYLENFKKQGINSVIIDLRDNTGGIVQEAISFSELFIQRGNVIMRSYNKGDDETVIKSKNTKTIDMNIVILVNEHSASATEIVAAALKDNKAATIVGTTTYGKGVMQEIIPVFDGALKVTIEEFKTPNGDKINKTGVTPDIIVEEDSTTAIDEQLQKAIEILR